MTAAAESLTSLRFTSRKAATDALTAIGCVREGSTFVRGSTRLSVYKRGTGSFALAILDGMTEWYASSVGGSVAADYAAGNVVTIRV